MHVDIYKQTVTVTREELRNHQTYLQVKEWLEKRYELVMPDPPRPDLRNAVVLTRAEARDHQTYKAKKEGKFLWVEESAGARSGRGFCETSRGRLAGRSCPARIHLA